MQFYILQWIGWKKHKPVAFAKTMANFNKMYYLGINCTVDHVTEALAQRDDIETFDWNAEDAWFQKQIRLSLTFLIY